MKPISKLKKSFDMWRQSHGGKLTGLPIELRSQAVQLLDNHSWKEVSTQLRVSTASLNDWRKSMGKITPRASGVVGNPPHSRPRTSHHESPFVEVECIVAPATKGPLTVTLEMPDGVSLRVDGPMDGYFVQGLVQVVCQTRSR